MALTGFKSLFSAALVVAYPLTSAEAAVVSSYSRFSQPTGVINPLFSNGEKVACAGGCSVSVWGYADEGNFGHPTV